MVNINYSTSNVLDIVLPTLLRRDFIITEAQLRSLFSSSITLIPASPNFAHLPDFAVYTREAGTAYTLGAAGNIQALIGANVMLDLATGIMTSGSASSTIFQASGSQSFGAYSAINNINNVFVGTALTLAQLTADMTGGSGRLFINLFYRDWPVGQLANQ